MINGARRGNVGAGFKPALIVVSRYFELSAAQPNLPAYHFYAAATCPQPADFRKKFVPLPNAINHPFNH
jgi:hypothetical protein